MASHIGTSDQDTKTVCTIQYAGASSLTIHAPVTAKEALVMLLSELGQTGLLRDSDGHLLNDANVLNGGATYFFSVSTAAAVNAAGKLLLSSETFKAGISKMVTSDDMAKALADQKAQILEELGHHRHRKAH